MGSFLDHIFQIFNQLHRVFSCEIESDQAVTFLIKFGFIADQYGEIKEMAQSSKPQQFTIIGHCEYIW